MRCVEVVIFTRAASELATLDEGIMAANFKWLRSERALRRVAFDQGVTTDLFAGIPGSALTIPKGLCAGCGII